MRLMSVALLAGHWRLADAQSVCAMAVRGEAIIGT
jgi:hypothetical protein